MDDMGNGSYEHGYNLDLKPDPVRSNGTSYNVVSFWMNGVLSLTLVITGMIGNISVMVSFHCCGGTVMKQRRWQAFYYYLMTFAMWNTGLLFATVLFNCIPALSSQNSPNEAAPGLFHLSSVFYLIGYWLGNCCVTADVWLAVVVTVERYLAVARPLRSRLTSPRRRARFLCILLSILVVFYNLPLAFELTFTTPDAQHENHAQVASLEVSNGSAEKGARTEESRRQTLCLSPLRDNVYYQFIYRVLAHVIFVSIVPFLAVLLLTIRVVLVVRESDRRRAKFRNPTVSSNNRTGGMAALVAPSPQTPAASCHHRYADVLLTLIAAKFLLFYTLPIVINIVELTTDPQTFGSEDSEPSKILLFLVDLANLLVVLDGATNSFFYFSWRSRAKVRRSHAPQGGDRGVTTNLVSRYGLGVDSPNGVDINEAVISKKQSGMDSLRRDCSARLSVQPQLCCRRASAAVTGFH